MLQVQSLGRLDQLGSPARLDQPVQPVLRVRLVLPGLLARQAPPAHKVWTAWRELLALPDPLVLKA